MLHYLFLTSQTETPHRLRFVLIHVLLLDSEKSSQFVMLSLQCMYSLGIFILCIYEKLSPRMILQFSFQIYLTPSNTFILVLVVNIIKSLETGGEMQRLLYFSDLIFNDSKWVDLVVFGETNQFEDTSRIFQKSVSNMLDKKFRINSYLESVLPYFFDLGNLGPQNLILISDYDLFGLIEILCL